MLKLDEQHSKVYDFRVTQRVKDCLSILTIHFHTRTLKLSCLTTLHVECSVYRIRNSQDK